MAAPQQFDMSTMLQNLMQSSGGQVSSNNGLIQSLLTRANGQLQGGLKRDLLSGLLGAGIGAFAGRNDASVGTGGGALFGALAGGLLSNKLRRTGVSNAITQIGTLQSANNDASTQFLNQAKMQGGADSIDYLANLRGLPQPSSPVYGSDAVLSQLGSLTPTSAVLPFAQMMQDSRMSNYGQGQGAGTPAATVQKGQAPATTALPAKNMGGGVMMEQDPSVAMMQQLAQGQPLQGNVQTGVPPVDYAGMPMPPALDNTVLQNLLSGIGTAGNTGLTQGVNAARVPSQNKQDEASAYKATQEGKYVPQDSGSRRIAAQASASQAGAANINAGANVTRSNAYAQSVNDYKPLQQQITESLNLLQDSDNTLTKQLNDKNTKPGDKIILRQQLQANQLRRNLVQQAILSGKPIDPQAMNGVGILTDFGG